MHSDNKSIFKDFESRSMPCVLTTFTDPFFLPFPNNINASYCCIYIFVVPHYLKTHWNTLHCCRQYLLRTLLNEHNYSYIQLIEISLLDVRQIVTDNFYKAPNLINKLRQLATKCFSMLICCGQSLYWNFGKLTHNIFNGIIAIWL